MPILEISKPDEHGTTFTRVLNIPVDSGSLTIEYIGYETGTEWPAHTNSWSEGYSIAYRTRRNAQYKITIDLIVKDEIDLRVLEQIYNDRINGADIHYNFKISELPTNTNDYDAQSILYNGTILNISNNMYNLGYAADYFNVKLVTLTEEASVVFIPDEEEQDITIPQMCNIWDDWG